MNGAEYYTDIESIEFSVDLSTSNKIVKVEPVGFIRDEGVMFDIY